MKKKISTFKVLCLAMQEVSTKLVVVCLVCVFFLFGCALKKPAVVKNSAIEQYEYVYIQPTKDLTSSSAIGTNGYVYGTTKSVNPSDVIAGILMKNNYVILPEIKPDLLDKTLIVTYGESGQRKTGLGSSAIEITIQFTDAKTSKLLAVCTAEGRGETEADDIRKAIRRALSSLFVEK